jgi:hypothetical protein
VHVHFPRRDAVLACQGHVEVAFVVAQVQIDLTAIVEDETFTMSGERVSDGTTIRVSTDILGGTHETSIGIEVGINLDRSNVLGC